MSRREWQARIPPTPPRPIPRETGIDRALREAAWQNERAVNYARAVFCLGLGAVLVIYTTWKHGRPSPSIAVMLAWGVVAVAAIPVLRCRYHPSLPFVFAAADMVVCASCIFEAYRDYRQVDLGEATTLIEQSLPANLMLLVAANMLRFSWRVTIWAAVVAYAAFLTATTAALGWRSSYAIQGLIFAVLVALLLVTSRRFRQVLLRVKERDAFARFLPAPAVERVSRDPTALNLGGEELEATVLFSDLRGFTALSSSLSAPRVVEMLNEYFREMVDEVFLWEGTLDKFIGDGLCAVFGPPLSPQEQATRALRCAMGMLARLKTLNAARRDRGERELRIGIGIHCGPVVAGNIGSPARMEYTHIGDTVNTASRIEGLTKKFGRPVVASQAVADRLGAEHLFQLRPLPRVRVKGKSRPLRVVSVEGTIARVELPARAG